MSVLTKLLDQTVPLGSYIYKTTNIIIFENGVYDMRIGKIIYFDTNMKRDPNYGFFDVRNMYIIDDLCLIVVFVHIIKRIQNFKCCIYRFSDGYINIFPIHHLNPHYKYIDGINVKVLYLPGKEEYDIIPTFAKWNKYYVSLNFKNQTIFFNKKFDIVLSHEGEYFANYPDTINPLYLAQNNIIIDSELNLTNMAHIYFIKWISKKRFMGSQDGKIYIYKIKNNVIELVDENVIKLVDENVIKLVDENEKECSICVANIKKKIALVPCGHTDICQECSNKIKRCPICKSEIEKVIRIF